MPRTESVRVPAKRKSPTIWRESDIAKLIDVWQTSINELRMAQRNSHVYKSMAEELKSSGVNVDHVEVRIKINNLTQRYRNEKREIGPSGGSPSTWPLYDQVHNILGRFISNDVSTMHESIVESCEISSLSEPSISAYSPETDTTGSEQDSLLILPNDNSTPSLLSPIPSASASIAEASTSSRTTRRTSNLKQSILFENSYLW